MSAETKIAKPNRILNQAKPWAILYAVGFFFLYLITSAPTNVGYADSDILLATAFKGGLAHPPGYPLFMFLLSLFLKIPIVGITIAQKGHMFSALWGSLTLAFVFLSSYLIYTHHKNATYTLISERFERWFIASITTCLLGSGYLFWTYAHVAEKYAFSAALTAASMFAIIRYMVSDVKPTKWLLIAATLLGISISHHQVLILLTIPFISAILYRPTAVPRKDIVKSIALIPLVFIGMYLIALVIISRHSSVGWTVSPDLEGLYRLITRRDFAGERYATSMTAGAYWSGIDLQANLQSLFTYLRILAVQTHWILLLPAIGLMVHAKIRSNLTNVLLITFAVLGIGFAAYMQIPTDDWGSQAVAMRQLVPGIVVLYLALVPGWHLVIEKIIKAASVLRIEGYSQLVLSLSGLALIGFTLTSSFQKADMRTYTIIQDRYGSILDSVDQNALITCFADTSCFALTYEQVVNNKRPDVDIIPLAYPYVAATLNQDNIRGFTYTDNPYLFFDVISWNVGKRPVYLVELNQYFYNFLGLSHPFLFYTPYTEYGQLTKTAPDTIPQPDYRRTVEWQHLANRSYDPMQLHHIASLGRDHLLNALFYIKYDRRDLSQEALNQAGNIFFDFATSEHAQVASIQTQISQSQPSEMFSKGSQVKSVDELVVLIDELIDNQQFSQAYMLAHAAILSDPADPRGHTKLAQLFEDVGETYFATKEYQHALMVDQDNATASAGLDRLNDVAP